MANELKPKSSNLRASSGSSSVHDMKPRAAQQSPKPILGVRIKLKKVSSDSDLSEASSRMRACLISLAPDLFWSSVTGRSYPIKTDDSRMMEPKKRNGM